LCAARQISAIEAMERLQSARQQGEERWPVGGAASVERALESLGLPVSLQVSHELIVDNTFKFKLSSQVSDGSAIANRRIREAKTRSVDRFDKALKATN